jgi:hypothetical protein
MTFKKSKISLIYTHIFELLGCQSGVGLGLKHVFMGVYRLSQGRGGGSKMFQKLTRIF